MMSSLSKASFIPCHFFQPFEEPEYLLAYCIFTAGSASISSIIAFWRSVRAAILMSLLAICDSSSGEVWKRVVRPG